MSKPISDFYTKDGVDKEKIENYLKQLEQERLAYLKEEQEKQNIAEKIRNSANDLKNESK